MKMPFYGYSPRLIMCKLGGSGLQGSGRTGHIYLNIIKERTSSKGVELKRESPDLNEAAKKSCPREPRASMLI
jgi:hypothetical protein